MEILFRGKSIISGKWVEGYYTFYPKGFSVSGKAEHVIRDTQEYEAKVYFIDPETVCQYTGLTDKNGRKIFDGDILSGKRYYDWGQGGEYLTDKCVIKWKDKRAAVDPVYWWEGYNHDLKNYEVIGNIYDNPELKEA